MKMPSAATLLRGTQLLVLRELWTAYRTGKLNKLRVAVLSTLLVTFAHAISPRFPLWARILGVGKHVVPRTVAGEVAPGFEAVREAFQRNVDEGLERGAQFVVYRKGKKIIDLHGGTLHAYDGDTQQIVFSNSKSISAIVLAKAVADGRIEYDAKVSKYWPEFAQNGKEDITVADVLRHDAGLAYFANGERLPMSLTKRDKLDALAEFFARQQPLWVDADLEPKSRAYHTYTRDFLTGELVRRADPANRSMGMILRSEVAEPLGVTLTLGPGTESEKNKVSPLKMETLAETIIGHYIRRITGPQSRAEQSLISAASDPKSHLSKSIKCVVFDTVRDKKEYFNDLEMHEMEIGSANVRSNARSLAKLADAMARRTLFPAKIHEAAMANPVSKFDHCLGGETAFTQGGFCKFGAPHWDPASDGYSGWGGMGGSQMLWNEEDEIGVAYVMNGNLVTASMGLVDPRFLRLQRALVRCLKAQEAK